MLLKKGVTMVGIHFNMKILRIFNNELVKCYKPYFKQTLIECCHVTSVLYAYKNKTTLFLTVDQFEILQEVQ